MRELAIKEKTGLWKISKFLSDGSAHAIYPHVYVPTRIYRDLESKDPNPQNIAYVSHEKKHIERQKEIGWIKWMALYAVSASFRLSEELIAIHDEMEVLKKKGLSFEIDEKARALSSWTYLKCVSFEDAKATLTSMWDSV